MKTKKSVKKSTRTYTRYANKKIVVVNREHGARPGTLRATGMDILLKSKNTDQAIKQFEKRKGIDNSFIRFAVEQGFIKLKDAA